MTKTAKNMEGKKKRNKQMKWQQALHGTTYEVRPVKMADEGVPKILTFVKAMGKSQKWSNQLFQNFGN